MTWTKTARLLLLLLALAALLAGPARAAPRAVVLGVPTTLTLLEGRESLMAVNLAVAEINAKGGVLVGRRRLPLKVVSVDLKGASPGVAVEQAVGAFRRFLDAHRLHALVVGPFRSEVLLESMELIAKKRLPLLGTIAMTPVSEAMVLREPRSRFVFRVGLNTRYLTDYLISNMAFLKQRFGFQRVYILNQDVAWARTTASMMLRLYFRRAGWEVLGQRTFPSTASDFSQALEEARTRGAQALLCIFDSPQSGQLAKQWRRLKVPALLCGFISPMVGPAAWQAFSGQIAGSLNMIFELGNLPSHRYQPAARFYRAYEKRYGRPVESGHGPAPSYEAVYVLAQAIERAGSLEPEAMVKALEATDRQGCMGRITFTRGHQAFFGDDPRREALAAVIQWTSQGRRRIVFPPAIAEGDVELPVFVPRP
ncbi:MAG: ABC transporter substrate-binding protein [Desulfarculaceae bacterium]|nr:ABC transporter substrate-binding protein [Desulfarculaceae bacterium]MCF8071585.1 ABC transporter substrate-binding protein [Desulfarculaceae bacterium]MCF8102400.1 ABC transporter substrate-binding protein [Desulfarculaceae bacterium]MCF8114864.1 ABC transporter substrate-binding protein [Desulfarculaceae bacterium]